MTRDFPESHVYIKLGSLILRRVFFWGGAGGGGGGGGGLVCFQKGIVILKCDRLKIFTLITLA